MTRGRNDGGATVQIEWRCLDSRLHLNDLAVSTLHFFFLLLKFFSHKLGYCEYDDSVEYLILMHRSSARPSALMDFYLSHSPFSITNSKTNSKRLAD